MKFDLDFGEELICSTHWYSRKFGLEKECCFEGLSSTDKKMSKGVLCQIKPKKQLHSRDTIWN